MASLLAAGCRRRDIQRSGVAVGEAASGPDSAEHIELMNHPSLDVSA